jgi:hypothetical protein
MLSEEQLEQLFYIKESAIHGSGLYSRVKFIAEDYMGEYDGPDVTENRSHVLWVEDEEDVWVGRDGKNVLRYLNHSAKPHAEFRGFELYAVREILPGEEITINYGEAP